MSFLIFDNEILRGVVWAEKMTILQRRSEWEFPLCQTRAFCSFLFRKMSLLIFDNEILRGVGEPTSDHISLKKRVKIPTLLNGGLRSKPFRNKELVNIVSFLSVSSPFSIFKLNPPSLERNSFSLLQWRRVIFCLAPLPLGILLQFFRTVFRFTYKIFLKVSHPPFDLQWDPPRGFEARMTIFENRAVWSWTLIMHVHLQGFIAHQQKRTSL